MGRFCYLPEQTEGEKIMNFWEFVLLIILIFITVVIVMCIIKKYSVKEATVICKNFIKEVFLNLFKPDEFPVVYPSIVGAFNGHIVASYVEEAFKDFSSCFLSFYYDTYGFTKNNNCIIYKFIIQKKDDDISDTYLKSLLQKQAEEVLSHWLHSFDVYADVESMTAIRLRDNELLVAYARTQEGILILANEKEKLRKQDYVSRYKANDKPASFTEDWSDE